MARLEYPLTFSVGDGVISAHLVFEIVAFQVALFVFYLERKGDAIAERSRLIVVIMAALGALLGSRVLAWVEHWDAARAGWSIYQYYGTKTIVGAIIGATLSVELTKRLIGERHSTGDRFVMPLIAGIFIGRIGCFLTGVSDHTTGIATTLPWGMYQGGDVPRHPTAIYEMLFLAMLGLIMLTQRKRLRRVSGMSFAIFLTAYLGFRLGVDFLKPSPVLWLGLSAIQWACLIMLCLYAIPRLMLLARCKETIPTST